jgi:hypothetical protein
MALTIIYTNGTGGILTTQQVSLLTQYIILTYQDDILKTTEKVGLGSNGDYRVVEYYLSSSENKSDIIQSYADGKSALHVYFNSQNQNSFTLWSSEGYSKDSLLTSKGVIVYNSQNWPVMYVSQDIKNYYGNQFSNQYEDTLLQFNYDVKGDLITVSDYNDTYGFGQGSLSPDDFMAYMQSIQEDFSWDEHPYFQALKPYLPDSNYL